MSDERKKVLDSIGGAMDKLNKKDLSYLVGFGDGLYVASQLEQDEAQPEEQEEPICEPA